MDRSTLTEQLDALGGSSRWWNERELRDLPSILQPDEEVLAIARGKVGRIRVMRRSWLVLATDQRLLCVRSMRGAGWRQFELRADQVRRVSLRIGPFRGRVLVHTVGETYRVLLPRNDAYDVFRALQGIAGLPQITGTTPRQVVRRVIDHILAFPAAALDPEPPPARRPAVAPPVPPPAPPPPEVQDRMEQLESETEELRQQVAFLEQLLGDRHTLKLP